VNAIIIDDERLARVELRRLLRSSPDVTVVGEAANADEAERLIEELRPDLIFLDIQMPGRDGFALLEGLESAPAVIFTTAYDEHALRAFDHNALDYLLKPIERGRLRIAIGKASERVGASRAHKGESPLGSDHRIFVRDDEQCWFVPLGDVRLFESEGNYTRLYFDRHKPLILRSLNRLEERLDPRAFFRANRRHIINLRLIENLEPGDEDKLIVRIAGAPPIEMSRRRAQRFREMMSV